jgi:hypothetical protein
MNLPSVPGRWSLVGSWPGTDILETTRLVLGEVTDPGIPCLPELPARGPGAEVIGRTAGMLVDMPVDLQPSGWRLVTRPGHDLRRARACLRQDLDVLAEVGEGAVGPLKIQMAGPWTLAASLRLPRLEPVVADAGACRDLVASLAEGAAAQVRKVARLLPGTAILVQLDEPSLPAVLEGRLPTASGYGRVRALEEAVVVEGLQAVLGSVRGQGAVGTLVHCCATDAPVRTLSRVGADALSLDVGTLGVALWEDLCTVVEAGTGLWAGAVQADDLVRPWRSMGLPLADLAQVVLTPPCGLAGSTPEGARRAVERTRCEARAMADMALG